MDLMGTPTHPHTPDCAATTAGLLPVPATLPQWERTMQRARAAGQMGQMAMALALALRLVQQTPPAGREDDCIAALVVSHLNVADLQVQAAEPDAAARLLGRAHGLLRSLVADGRCGAALRQAAWRHGRETHAALLAHVRSHGSHPAITQALAGGGLAGLSS
ncbi:hypothetical protein [Acidovorax sp.]|uniref:hypothetical protein n=1 Tax=Acidovorax sp. TaxID=1872122 RepID=UPI0025C48658|nr:hypothetical protein [Acidovorax sp.]MBW8466261.1 hypothetical protein [Acidovorax sp.]